jgi:hypothetical protein
MPFFLPFIIPFAANVLLGGPRVPPVATRLIERLMVGPRLADADGVRA